MNVMRVLPVVPNYINRIYLSIQNYILQNNFQVIIIRSSIVGSNMLGLLYTTLITHIYLKEDRAK